MHWLLVLAAIVAGALNPAQSGANAELNKQFGHALPATITVYATGLASLLFFQIFFRQGLPDPAKFGNIPWWPWCGGVISLAPTIAGLTLAQKMGSGIFTGVTVTAAVVVSILFDHFALLGFKHHPASAPRIVGSALMIAGIWLVATY